jgi:hypothetical protein
LAQKKRLPSASLYRGPLIAVTVAILAAMLWSIRPQQRTVSESYAETVDGAWKHVPYKPVDAGTTALSAAEVNALVMSMLGGTTTRELRELEMERAHDIQRTGLESKKISAAEASLYRQPGDPALATFSKRALQAAVEKRNAEIIAEDKGIAAAVLAGPEAALRKAVRHASGDMEYTRIYPPLPTDMQRADIKSMYGEMLLKKMVNGQEAKGLLPDILPLMNKYETALLRRMRKLHPHGELADIGRESAALHLSVEALEHRLGAAGRVRGTAKWWTLLRRHMHEKGWASTASILDAREAATLRWASRYAIEYFDPTHEPGNPTELVVRVMLRNSVFNNHAAHMRDRKNRLCMNPDGTEIVHPEDALDDGGLGALRHADPAAEVEEEEEEEGGEAHRLTPSQRLARLAADNPLNELLMKPTYTPEEIREQLKGTGMDEALPMYNMEKILAKNKERGTMTSPALLRGLTHISAGGANAYGGAAVWKASEESERFCVSRQPFDRAFNPHRALTAETHPLSAVAFAKGLSSHIYYTDEMQRIVTAVARSQRLGEVAAALLGVPKAVGVRLYASSLYYKRSGDWYTSWHWDNIASPFDKPLMTCWIALNAVDRSMGALTFASGSHARAEQDDARQRWTHADVERAFPGALEPRGARMWPGDATWHHGGTLHAAWLNEGERTREAIAITYVAANARLRSGAELSESIRADDIATWAEWLPRSEFYEHGGRQLRGCVASCQLLRVFPFVFTLRVAASWRRGACCGFATLL